MKIHRFTEPNDFDLNFVMTKIKEKYSHEDVKSMFDNEWPEWVDDDWEESGSESDEEWYKDHNNGEAQDIVITSILNWYTEQYDTDITLEEEDKLTEALKKEYPILQ